MTPLAIFVDFDGTACPVDVADALLSRFGRAGWQHLDIEVAQGTRTIRSGIDHQAGMLTATRSAMLEYALTSFSVSADFIEFSRWARSRNSGLTVLSDGFGFYVRPMLNQAGLSDIRVATNRLVGGRRHGWRLSHPASHPVCVGCGTCKILPIQKQQVAGKQVAFVGDGASDRFAAWYADMVFAKEELAEICGREGISFFQWDTFMDVRHTLERTRALSAAHPPRCPGWTEHP